MTNLIERLLGGKLPMAEVITKIYQDSGQAINQCDIFRNIEFIEYVEEGEASIEISKIVFPLVIILTQACDLQQDFNSRKKIEEQQKNGEMNEYNHDKFLISVIVAPIYNFEDFRAGNHLSQLGMNMEPKGSRKKSLCKNIIQNENKRYHYLNFGKEINIVESVIDFKHYFTVNVRYLRKIKQNNYVCSICSLHRELILQRFSNFINRIGLPEPEY